jgi:hypothetical protein
MRTPRIVAAALTASTATMLAAGLAACAAGTVNVSATPVGSAPARSTTPGLTSRSSAGLTPPGKHLGFGQEATVGWVPLSDSNGTGAHKGLKLAVTVVSIEKGSIADFKNVELSGNERHSTPYYVTVRIKALGAVPPPGTNDPAITFQAIDDRGQQQESITFLGTFSRCNDNSVPRPFVNGRSYESCLAYLMPGGGSITQVEWNDGPAAADQVTPYFDKPVVWAGH